MKTSSWALLVAVVALAIAATALFSQTGGPKAPPPGSTAGKTATAGTYIAGTGFGVGTEQSFSQVISSTKASLFSYSAISGATVNSTSTVTSTLLTDTDLSAYSDIRFAMSPAPTTGFTLTLPASSTLTSFISTTVGSQRGIVIENSATTTSGKNITLAGGTGTFLTPATSTATLIIPPNRAQFLQCVRMASSDIACALTGI